MNSEQAMPIESFRYHDATGEPWGEGDIYSTRNYQRLFHSDNIRIDVYRDIVDAIRLAETITAKNERAVIIKELQR